MKRTSLNMLMGLIEAWVRLYTLGMPEGVRRARQDEIKSDIWEHCQDLKRENKPITEIISRLLRGMTADIIWRFIHSEGAIARVFMSLPQACIKVLAVLAGIFVVLPLVTTSLVIALFVMIILGFVIAFPFYYKAGTIILGSWVVDTFGEAVIASIIGFVLLAVIVLLIRWFFRLVSRHVSLRISRLHAGLSE